ncbi:hypothetical protein JCM6882_004057 [Rhodosporidiobolus microsporus]
MSLSRNVNPERVLKAAREHHHRSGVARPTIGDMLDREGSGHLQAHPLSDRYGTEPIPKYQIPSKGVPAKEAYELVNSELSLDGNPLLNLASFVHTNMDEYADRIMHENRAKNLVDQDEYPATTLIHSRLVSMCAKLWHADDTGEDATGTATTGSSEAIQLAGMAMKRRWQARRKAEGKSIHEPGPNIVMGSEAQVALEKFANYWECDARMVPVDASTKYVMSPQRALEQVDENTIGIFVILGSTYTGTYEDVGEMARLLDEYQAKTGIDIPIHVDAASGGFVAPFATPSLVWDFKIPRVVSINASVHKFGASYVGCGMVVWRDKQHLPKELVFELHYLGSVEYSFSLNFSRPAAPILAAYFNFLYLGFDGYRRIALHDAKNARLLSRALERSKYYTVISEVHRLKNPSDQSLTDKAKQTIGALDDIELYTPALPVVAFQFTQAFKREYPRIKQRSIQKLLREHEWIVPNYELPPNVEKEEVLRVVVREKFNEDLVERLFTDLIQITEQLMEEHKAEVPHPGYGNGSKSDNELDDASFKKAGKATGRGIASVGERLAASHGEGVRPIGHDGPCFTSSLVFSRFLFTPVASQQRNTLQSLVMSTTVERRKRDRFKIFSTPKRPALAPDQPMRLPIELILDIINLATETCADNFARQRFHANLACVNRAFSFLYRRREWRTVDARAGLEVGSLIQRLKGDRDGKVSNWIEGIETEDLMGDYQWRKWADFWPELQKRCKHLAYVRLGSSSIAPTLNRSIAGHTLFSMSGITSLRLIRLEVAHVVTPSTFFGKKSHLVPLFPPNLRHLVLDRLQISHILNEKDLDSLFPPPEACHLVSFYVADLRLTALIPKPDTLTSPLRAFVGSNSRTLQALHYSRPRATRVEPETPFFTPGFLLPNLRLLSLSLLHFSKDVLSAVPNLEHLTLTLCDLVGAYDHEDRAQAVQDGGALLVDTFSSGSALKSLRVLVLGVRWAPPKVDVSEWAGVEAAAQAAGVKTERWDEVHRWDLEERFRSSVRVVLLERM